MPIFVSTITTIVVFLPTVFLEGQAKLLFIPLTFTISCSMFASFLVSRTVTPLLCLHWLRPDAPVTARNLYTRVLGWSGQMIDALDEVYQRVIAWALGHRLALIGGVLAGFALALWMANRTAQRLMRLAKMEGEPKSVPFDDDEE